MSIVTYNNINFDIMAEIYKQNAYGFLDITRTDISIYSGIFLNLKTLVKLRLLGMHSISINTRRRTLVRLDELLN
jgi:hypothetical protein